MAGLKKTGKQKQLGRSQLKKVDCSLLPPCKNVLRKKLARCQYVSRMWWNSDQPNPTEGLNPENHGWKLHEGHIMVPVWFDGQSFSDISARSQEETNDDRLGDSSK